MNLHLAERIIAQIESAKGSAERQGQTMDLHDLYVRILVRCGLCSDEAAKLVKSGEDPVRNILHYAGESHNFAMLAVEEALAEAC